MPSRRTVLAGLGSLPLLSMGLSTSRAFAQATTPELDGDKLATTVGDLIIHPVEHASLLLAWNGQVIYVDPVGGPEKFDGLPPATAVLVTHGHGDHFDVPTLQAVAFSGIPLITSQEVFDKLPDDLKTNATALANGAEGSLNSIPLAAVPAHNTTPERMNYHPVGVGNGYLIKFGDKIVYVAGDTEPTPEMLALENIDVAFLPMNLPYTMTVEQAAEAINTFKPKIVYPYHYKGSDVASLDGLVGEQTEVRLREWYPNGQSAG